MIYSRSFLFRKNENNVIEDEVTMTCAVLPRKLLRRVSADIIRTIAMRIAVCLDLFQDAVHAAKAFNIRSYIGTGSIANLVP